MKRMMLPLWALLLVVACGDNPSSADNGLPESSSSSKIESSSSTKAESSSSSKIASSSSKKIASSSSSSCHSKPDPESSSSSSKKKKSSSSSMTLSSSSETLSSSSSSCHSKPEPESSSSSSHQSGPDPESSSSEVLSDPSKIFEIRKPKPDVLPCEIPAGGEYFMRDTLSQQDIICTYDYNGEQGFLYVQLTPISCSGGMSITPGHYNVDKAEFYVNGEFADVSNVEYEWGGNHHVEKLNFTYNGNVFRYAQSTMGWGGRPCQRMDCLKVFESDGKTYVENGCNERSLPIVCGSVNYKGEVPDFTDKYEICEGDPRTFGYEVEY